MRLAAQIGLIAVLAAAGAGVWYLTTGNGDDLAAGPGNGPGGRPVGVVAAAATSGQIDVTFDAVGTLRAYEAVTVTSKVSGVVRAIGFAEGQQVAAGAMLVELDDTEVRAQLAVSEAERRNVAQDLERSQALLGRQAVAQARVDDLRIGLQAAEARVNAARARLQDMQVRAPFAGVAGLRQVSPGALVRPGDVITTLDDLSTLRLEFTVPETALRALVPEMPIAATTPVWPGEQFRGKVTAIDTRVEPTTRTIQVIADLPNPDARLKPGMFMTVRLRLENRENVVLIPEEALVPIGDRQFVFAVVDGKAQRRAVRIGARLGGQVEVASGLAAGELVVTRGTQKIRDGQPVQADVAQPQTALRPNTQS